MNFLINARGHPNVLARHRATIELTTEDFLTRAGDCIIGVCADKTLAEFPKALKGHIRAGKRVKITLECGGFKDVVTGEGDPRLTLSDKKSMVIRKSDYACGRTLCVRADKAAIDLDRRLIAALKEGKPLKAAVSAA